MQEFLFNDGWKYRRLGEGAWTPVTLPHDAMIGEERSDGAAGGTNTGWFAGYDYEYEKTFFVPLSTRTGWSRWNLRGSTAARRCI